MSKGPKRGWAFGVAGGGVLLGHWITYLMVAPDAAERATLLARTGHAYLGAAYQAGLAVTLIAVAALFLGQVIRPEAGRLATGRLTLRLAGFQAAAFVAMEAGERLSSGAPLGGLFHGPLLPIAMAVQFTVAFLGAIAIRWILGAAEIAAAAGGVPPLLRRPTATPLILMMPLASSGTGPRHPRGRGPPSAG
jgi:hypothetical protein